MRILGAAGLEIKTIGFFFLSGPCNLLFKISSVWPLRKPKWKQCSGRGGFVCVLQSKLQPRKSRRPFCALPAEKRAALVEKVWLEAFAASLSLSLQAAAIRHVRALN